MPYDSTSTSNAENNEYADWLVSVRCGHAHSMHGHAPDSCLI